MIQKFDDMYSWIQRSLFGQQGCDIEADALGISPETPSAAECFLSVQANFNQNIRILFPIISKF